MRTSSRLLQGLEIERRRHLLRVALPGIALLLACVLVLVGREALERKNEAYAQRLADAEASLRDAESRRIASAPERYSDAALQQIGREVGLINRDWSSLLAALVPETPDVRLLAVDVDPAAGTVRVSGNAERAAGANGYSALLDSRDGIDDVRLVSLERSGGQVVFELVARWRE